jgi:DNA primase catalytic subunit
MFGFYYKPRGERSGLQGGGRLGAGGAAGSCFRGGRAIQFERVIFEEAAVQLDDQLKQLLRELGHAINDSVSDSERIAGAIANVRAAGYDIVLKLDATIGLAKRESEPSKITPQDRRFLESLHIQVDQEVLNDEQRSAKFEITPQDIRFLKSLKISLDDSA